MRKKILLVDDQSAFITGIKRTINSDDTLKIEVSIFGHDVGEIKDNNVGASFLQYLKENQDEYIVDVIFCDYQLEHGITAIDILDIAKEIHSLPPIVVMTANTAQIHTEARQAIEHGARGYIIKTREELAIDEQRSSFVRDIFTATHRVYEEHQQRVAYNIANKIQADISVDISSRIQTLAQTFRKSLLEYYPYYTIIIRTYTQGSLNLLDANINIRPLSESINHLSISENPIFNDLINGKETIKTNVDMQDAFKNQEINSNIKGAIEQLQLHKGIIAKVQDSGLPLGTAAIYCSQKDREFDTMSISYFEHIINAFSMQWKQIHQNIRNHEVLTFINEILHMDNEQEVWDRLLELIHRHYNSDSQKTKSTIKIHNLKANTLERISCEGETCDDNIKTINIDDPNISAWVFRNKWFCVLGAEAFVNIDKKELKQDFISDLTKNRPDKHIKYVESNPDILSELCIPILLDKQPIAILNLESTHVDAYASRDKSRRISIEKLLDHSSTKIAIIRGRSKLTNENTKLREELKKLNHNLMDISHTYKDYIEIENKIDTLQKNSITDKDILTYVKYFTTGLNYIFKIGSLKAPEKTPSTKISLSSLLDEKRLYIKTLKKFLTTIPHLLKEAEETSFELMIKGNSDLQISPVRQADIEAIFFEYIFNAIKQNKDYGSKKGNKRNKITIIFFLTNDAIYIGNNGKPIDEKKSDKVFKKHESWQADNPDENAGLGIGLYKCKAYLSTIKWKTELINTPINVEELKDCTVVFKFKPKESTW